MIDRQSIHTCLYTGFVLYLPYKKIPLCKYLCFFLVQMKKPAMAPIIFFVVALMVVELSTPVSATSVTFVNEDTVTPTIVRCYSSGGIKPPVTLSNQGQIYEFDVPTGFNAPPDYVCTFEHGVNKYVKESLHVWSNLSGHSTCEDCHYYFRVDGIYFGEGQGHSAKLITWTLL